MRSPAPMGITSGPKFQPAPYKKCPMCDWQAVSPSAIDAHMKREHPGHPTMHSHQNQQYYGIPQSFDVERLEVKNHNQTCSTCISGKACGYEAVSDADLDKHQRNVHVKRRISAPQKWRQMRKEEDKENNENLLIPKPKKRRHGGCEESVSAEAKNHQTKMRKTLLMKLPCPYKDKTGCLYVGPRKQHLDNHIKTHLSEEKKKDLECDRCDRKFADASNLTRHKRQIHDKLLKWRCDKCKPPYASAIKGDLMRHYRSHTHKKMEQWEQLDLELANRLNSSRPNFSMAGNNMPIIQVVNPDSTTYQTYVQGHSQHVAPMANQMYVMQIGNPTEQGPIGVQSNVARDFPIQPQQSASIPQVLFQMTKEQLQDATTVANQMRIPPKQDPLRAQDMVAPCSQTQSQQVTQTSQAFFQMPNEQVQHALSMANGIPTDLMRILSEQPLTEAQEILASSSEAQPQQVQPIPQCFPHMPMEQVQQHDLPVVEHISTDEMEILNEQAPIGTHEIVASSSELQSQQVQPMPLHFPQMQQEANQMPVEQPQSGQVTPMTQDLIQMPKVGEDELKMDIRGEKVPAVTQDIVTSPYSPLSHSYPMVLEHDNVVIVPNPMLGEEQLEITSEFSIDEHFYANFPPINPEEGSQAAHQINLPNQMQERRGQNYGADELGLEIPQDMEQRRLESSMTQPLSAQIQGQPHNLVEDNPCEVEPDNKKGAYVCEKCGYDAKDKGHLKIHEIIHTGNKHVCQECDFVTFKRGYLDHHMKSCHPKQEELCQQMTHGDPQVALRGILMYNVGECVARVLDTRAISNRVRELLSTRNTNQKIFAKHVLGVSKGTVSKLLSKPPKSWEMLNKRQKHIYRMMHAWCYDEDAIRMLKLLMPKKSSQASKPASPCPQPSYDTEERAQHEPPVTEQMAAVQEDVLAEAVAQEAVVSSSQEQVPGEHEVGWNISLQATSEECEPHVIVQPVNRDDERYSSLAEDFGQIEGSLEVFNFKIEHVMEGITEEGLEDELNALKKD